jgi:hypothetical protein
MDPIIVTKPVVGIAHMQLCAKKEVPDEELLAYANRVNPSGTELGWCTVLHSNDGKPITCSDDPERTHYLLVC